MKERPENMIDITMSIDKLRRLKGFMSLQELIHLSERNNVILDPFSTLISYEVEIGEGNIIYPSVTIEASLNGRIKIGNNNYFYPQTFLLAGPGEIVIGNSNQFGDGGASFKANQEGTKLIIGDGGRYLNQVQVLGNTNLGSGSQLIGGPLTIQNCSIGAGETFSSNDPDLRGGVVKGFGLARNLIVNQGEVINGSGVFDQTQIQRQSFYHPKK